MSSCTVYIESYRIKNEEEECYFSGKEVSCNLEIAVSYIDYSYLKTI